MGGPWKPSYGGRRRAERHAPGARANESSWKLWLFQEADRWLVTAVLLGGFFLALLAAGVLYGAAASAPWTGDSVDTTFQAYVTATITGVTLVLTLNQLVLSQELGAIGDQRERMEGAMDFREDVADAIGAPVSPARPSQFLTGLVEMSGERARELRDAVDAGDEDVRKAVDDLVDSLVENADRVADDLGGAQFGRFDVVSSALNFNYSWKVFTARRIGERYGDRLGADATGALEDLVTVLELFGPAREHFKTLYFQWELINLSRAIMAAALPALAASTIMVAFYDPSLVRGRALGVHYTALTVTAAATVSSLPFVVLLSYILRIATVTKHTLSIGPFILRETDRVEPVEWDR